MSLQSRLGRAERGVASLTTTGLQRLAAELQEALTPPQVRYAIWTPEHSALIDAEPTPTGYFFTARPKSGSTATARWHMTPAEAQASPWRDSIARFLDGEQPPPFPDFDPETDSTRLLSDCAVDPDWQAWTDRAEEVSWRIVSTAARSAEADVIFAELIALCSPDLEDYLRMLHQLARG